jgi:hypothetical protein
VCTKPLSRNRTPYFRPPINLSEIGIMDKWTFGVSVTVVGMGGTLLTLWLLSLVTMALKKIFPPLSEVNASKGASKSGGIK